MKTRKLLSLVVAIAMVLSMASFAMAEDTQLPREETLYFGGQQWGTVISWNPIGTNQNNAMVIGGNAGGVRTLMFETLYMYNFLDGSQTPLLAIGDPEVSEDMITTTVKLNPAAKWSDGTAVTANDVVRTYEISVEIGNATGTNYGPYIEKIEAADDSTVVITAASENGAPKNPLLVKEFLSTVIIAQAAWIDSLCEACGNDATAIINATCIEEDGSVNVPYTGPYGRYYDDDQKVVLVRNDEYWGQDESMWGKLPVPKYIAHAMYADNNATAIAFKAGEIDVDQQFFSDIQKLWEEEDLPISTYKDEAPYGICLTMPTAWYNMNNSILADNVAIRKAIAMAVDYDQINANAMTGQSDSFADVPRSVMNPTSGEQALYDQAAVADLQWVGNQVDEANALLDEAGIVDTDGDGYREINGEKLSFNCVCPNGWTDWQASMEIVAAAGSKIGIEITTLYPEYSTYQTVFTDPAQTEYDIFMWSPEAAGPASPWKRVRQFLSSDLVGVQNNWSGNWGQYTNERADEILAAIPMTTDEEELKALYTEAVEIYLTEVPSFSLMYRPSVFHAVNESVWTNYPEDGDGTNIPPADCTDGYGIAALYNLELVG